MFHVDLSLASESRAVPLSTSRYPPDAAALKAFTFHQQEQFRAAQRVSLIQYSKANHLHLEDSLESFETSHAPARPFSPSVSPSHALFHLAPPTPRSILANSAAHTLALSLQPYTNRPVPPHIVLSSTSNDTSPGLTASSTSFAVRPSRMPSFHVDKFLTSHQHLSTVNERLHVTAVLKKDARLRSPYEVESMGKFLQTIDVFSDLTLAVCIDLARQCRLKKYNREEVIYREGDDATSFYVIMTGSVGTRMQPQLTRGDEKSNASSPSQSEGYIAGIEYAGSSLGSDSFSSSLLPRHSSTRMAIERCELLAIDMSDYASCMRMHRREEEKQRMHVLKHIKAFELCTPQELWHIAQHMTPLRLTKNQLVFTQGEHADRIYFVSTGECRAIFTQPQADSPHPPMYLDLGRLRQYSFFGELAMFREGGVRSCTVYAETSCALYVMAYDEFKAKVPRFVAEAMKEWGDVLYAKEEEGELDGMMRAEKKWLTWKAKMMEGVRPQEMLKKEANRSGKWEGRAHMHFK